METSFVGIEVDLAIGGSQFRFSAVHARIQRYRCNNNVGLQQAFFGLAESASGSKGENKAKSRGKIRTVFPAEYSFRLWNLLNRS